MLQAELGEILRMQPQKIDPISPLNELGLDSLMGVELVAALESRFDIRLSAMVLRESRNLTRVAHIIYDKLKGEEKTNDSLGLSGKQQPIQHLSEQRGGNIGRQENEELVASHLENIRQIRSIIE
jgi:acyl carrier protein